MRKQLLIATIMLMLLAVGLSGCTDQQTSTKASVTIINNFSGKIEGIIEIKGYEGEWSGSSQHIENSIYQVTRDVSLGWDETKAFYFDEPKSLEIGYYRVRFTARHNGISNSDGVLGTTHIGQTFTVYGTGQELYVKYT